MKRSTKKKFIIGAGITGAVLYAVSRKKPPELTNYSERTAHQIGLDLGTAYPLIDPRHWTENDEAAEDLILSIPQAQIPNVSTDYRKLFNRDLVADLQKFLSGYDRVKYKFMASGLDKALLKIKN